MRHSSLLNDLPSRMLYYNVMMHKRFSWSSVCGAILSVLLMSAASGCASLLAEDDGPRRAARPETTSTPAGAIAGRDAAPIPIAATSDATRSPLSATQLQTLSTAEQLRLAVVPTRDLGDLAQRLDPDIDHVPVVALDRPVEYEIGAVEEFWVHESGHQ